MNVKDEAQSFPGSRSIIWRHMFAGANGKIAGLFTQQRGKEAVDRRLESLI